MVLCGDISCSDISVIAQGQQSNAFWPTCTVTDFGKLLVDCCLNLAGIDGLQSFSKKGFGQTSLLWSRGNKALVAMLRLIAEMLCVILSGRLVCPLDSKSRQASKDAQQ